LRYFILYINEKWQKGSRLRAEESNLDIIKIVAYETTQASPPAFMPAIVCPFYHGRFQNGATESFE